MLVLKSLMKSMRLVKMSFKKKAKVMPIKFEMPIEKKTMVSLLWKQLL